jgi:hypothetical protein
MRPRPAARPAEGDRSAGATRLAGSFCLDDAMLAIPVAETPEGRLNERDTRKDDG